VLAVSVSGVGTTGSLGVGNPSDRKVECNSLNGVASKFLSESLISRYSLRAKGLMNWCIFSIPRLLVLSIPALSNLPGGFPPSSQSFFRVYLLHAGL
jgi:hypothetical protein